MLSTILLALTLTQTPALAAPTDLVPLQEVIEKRAFILQTKLESSDSAEISSEVNKTANLVNLHPSLILAIIELESRYSKKSKSKKGCLGLTQVSKRTGRYMAQKLKMAEYDLTQIKDNILIGMSYLRELIDQFDGNIKTAITVYNKGIVQWINNPTHSRYANAVMKRYKHLKGVLKTENSKNFCFHVDKKKKSS